MRSMPVLEGSCHCGNIAVSFETRSDPASLPLRACGCGFCRRHGARTMTDPRGRARIVVRDPGLLSRYSFGLHTAEFYVCARCGAYAAAVLRDGEAAFATVNANLFDDPGLDRAAQPVSYEGESREDRIARRKRTWTPVV